MKLTLFVILGLALWQTPEPRCCVPPPGHAAGRNCDEIAGKTERREDDDKVYGVREVTCRAQLLSRPAPDYPPGARSRGVEGTVTLRVVLRASGKVGTAKVMGGLSHGADEAAIRAAKKIKFRPAIKGDRWVSQYAVIQYQFNTY